VSSDPAAEMNPNGGDLFPVDPNTRFTRFAVSRDAEVRERADGRLFQKAKVPVDIALRSAEFDDRVDDELAGPMICRTPAPVCDNDVNIPLLEQIHGAENLLGDVTPEAPTEGNDRGMFEKKQRVGKDVSPTALLKEVLNEQPILVFHQPEPANVKKLSRGGNLRRLLHAENYSPLVSKFSKSRFRCDMN
jgi:hypothetical protein